MTVRRTFSLPQDLAERLDQRARTGSASAYVATALEEKLLRDEAGAKLQAAYGEPDPEAMAYWMLRFTGEDQGPAQASPQSA